MIRLFRVSKIYNSAPALKNISFVIDKNEFLYITGPSGAGKTTLLKLLFCEEQPTAGQIIVNGKNIARISARHIPPYRREIGFVFQDFRLIKNKTVYENVALLPQILGMGRKERTERANYYLKLVGLEHKGNEYPPALSGGEQQRVAIARALIGEPALFLADEPTGNLDPELSEEVIQLFKRIHAIGTTIIIATHDRSLIARHPKRTIFLKYGELVEDTEYSSPKPADGFFF